MDARDAAVIAEACREYLAAHELRAPTVDRLTLNEYHAAVRLRDALSETRVAA